jgi:PAS domain S-box-containing protein
MDFTNKTKEQLIIELQELEVSNTLLKEQYEREISILKLAHEKAVRSEEKFRKAFITSPDSVNINRLSDGMYVSVNEGFTKILGYSEDDALGKTSLELNIWVDQGRRKDLVQELHKNGSVEKFEAAFLKRDGSTVIGSMSASIIDLDGVPHVLSVTRDITLSKKAEQALSREQLFMSALMNNLADYIYIKDCDSKFLRINKSHAIALGFDDPDQVIGKTDFDLFTKEHSQVAYEDEQSIVRTGQTINKEEKLTWDDRPDMWVYTTKMPLYDKEGKIIGTFGISRNITEQKKSEEQILLLANSLKSVNECVSITDMDDKVLFLNKAFLDTYGFDKNDLKEESISYIRSPNNPSEIINEILPETIRGGWHGELLNRKKDGTEFPVSLSTAVIKNNQGEPIAMIGVASDITESKKTEAALRLSEERFRSVAQSANDAIITTDSTGIILGWNRGAENSFGYNESEILGKSLDILVPENYLEMHIKGIKHLTQDGEKHVIGKTVELNGLRKNGNSFPLELSLSEWETSEGRFFTGIIRDISRRRRIEMENQVVYEISQGITTTSNLDELLKLIHKSLEKVVYAENLFVALYDEKTGLFSFPYFVDKLDPVYPPSSMAKSCTAYVFRTLKPFLFDQNTFDRLLEKDEVEQIGSPSPSWIGIPLQTPSKVIGVLVLQHYEKEDVYTEKDEKFLTSVGSQIALAIERKKAEEEILLKNELLQTVNDEKDKFFSIIAHDLRGPLSAFVAASQIITEEIQTMAIDEIKALTVSMKTSATNIYSLLENLLEWSRLRRGGIDFVPQMINLKKKTLACIAVLNESARQKGIEIEVSVPGDIEVFADNNMLDALIRNLVSNALKFSAKGGKVNIIGGYYENKSVQIKISDTGIGMTQELKNKMFMMNERTSRPGTAGESSTGLGLLLCKEFVEKHNGKIWVESEPGKGSTFSFTIPGRQ